MAVDITKIDELAPPFVLGDIETTPTPVAAANIPSIAAKNALYEMLAQSETFQAALGISGTVIARIAAAKLKIFKTAYISDAMIRPFAVICKNQSDKHSAIGGGESQNFLPSGGLEVRLERAVPEEFLETLDGGTPGDITEGSENAAEEDFETFYEGIIADINALAGREGFLFIRNWDVLEGPTLFDSSNAQKNIYAIKLLCNWGIE